MRRASRWATPASYAVFSSLQKFLTRSERGWQARLTRKDVATLRVLLEPYHLASDLRDALLSVPDLYGDIGVLTQAKRLAPWAETRGELERLEVILGEFEDDSELLFRLRHGPPSKLLHRRHLSRLHL